MRSRAVLAFRAVVMLSVLVLIPLVAVSGPEMLQFLGGLLPQGPRQTEITAQTSAGSMPGGQPQDSRAPAGPWDRGSVRPSSGHRPGGEAASPAGSPWPPQSGASPRETAAVMGSPAIGGGPRPSFSTVPPPHGLPAQASADGIPLDGASRSPGGRRDGRPVGSGVVAASHSAPVGQPYPHQWPPTGSPQQPGSGSQPAPAGAEVTQDSRFVAIQRRLRELGATYYVLETWGEGGKLLRFYCRVAVAGNPECNRYFEATDADPLAAMAKVLAEVESWRAARP